MNRIVSAVLAPLRVGAMALAAVGGGASMLFTRAAGWGVMWSRTLINYQSEVGDPMRNSAVAASVGWIARNFPEAPVRIRLLSAGSGDDAYVQPAATGAGYMLRLLERPNQVYSGVLQWMATIVDFMAGNAYWIKVRDGIDRPAALWWVPRVLIEPRWPENDPTVFISHYEYRVNGTIYRIAPRDVVHFRNGIDPMNPRKGLSPFGSLLREIFTDDEAASFTAQLLRNLGVPGVVIAPSSGSGPMKTDPETIKAAYMDKFGGDRRGEPMVLTSPTDVKVLSWSPDQLSLKTLRRIPEERITAVLGIPAIVAGLGAGLDRSTFTNAGEANVSAYTQGVIPLHRLIAAELEVQLLTDFADLDRDPLDVDFDWTKSTAMAAATDAIWKRYLDAMKVGGVTRAEFKRATGQHVDATDNVYVIPNNYIVVPAGGTQSPSGLPSVTRPVLPAGASIEPLLLAAETGSEVRCGSCDKLLAEAATAPYRMTCPRCKVVTEEPAQAIAA